MNHTDHYETVTIYQHNTLRQWVAALPILGWIIAWWQVASRQVTPETADVVWIKDEL